MKRNVVMKVEREIPELSRMKEYGIIWLDENDRPCNTPFADRYHQLLKDTLNIDVVGSYAELSHGQLSVYLWITKQNSASRQVETPFNSNLGEELCNGAVECLKMVLAEQGISLPNWEQFLAEHNRKDKRKIKNAPEACLYIYSYDWMLYDRLMFQAKKEINKMIQIRFARRDVACLFTSIERIYEAQNHVFMFPRQHDVEQAKQDGFLDNLLDESYRIVQKFDKHGLVTRESYHPDVVSKDQFSEDMLFWLARD